MVNPVKWPRDKHHLQFQLYVAKRAVLQKTKTNICRSARWHNKELFLRNHVPKFKTDFREGFLENI